MARFTRIQVAHTIYRQGMLPLFYHPDVECCREVARACYAGGARLLEFTNRGDFAQEVFGLLQKFVASELPEMALGAGSITDAATAALYLQMGADFIVTPVVREDVIRTCNRRKILCLPGCMSLSDVAFAEELGCEIVKLFPAGVLGPDLVRYIKGPQPWSSLMPTSGVAADRESLRQWFEAGVAAVGLGSPLISGDILGTRDFATLEKRVYDILSFIQEFKFA